MTIKTVRPKELIILPSAISRGLVTATSKGHSRNLADFDPATLLGKKRQKNEPKHSTLAPNSNE